MVADHRPRKTTARSGEGPIRVQATVQLAMPSALPARETAPDLFTSAGTTELENGCGRLPPVVGSDYFRMPSSSPNPNPFALGLKTGPTVTMPRPARYKVQRSSTSSAGRLADRSTDTDRKSTRLN